MLTGMYRGQDMTAMMRVIRQDYPPSMPSSSVDVVGPTGDNRETVIFLNLTDTTKCGVW